MSRRPVRRAALVAAGFLIGAAWGAAERRALREQLSAARHAATHDPLTGLPNRAGLARGGPELLRQAAETGQQAAVLLFDLDGFKPVNDLHGHDVGDRVLQATAERIGARCAGHGVAARLGGDEFAAVIIGQEPEQLAQLLGADVAAPIPAASGASVGASVGMVLVDAAEVVDLSALLARADSAMYRAKRTGGGVAVYDPATDRGTSDTRPAERERDAPRAVLRIRQLRTSGPNGRTFTRPISY
jgi:diguanylate cyclase (GGDEF)-like protein